MISRTLEYIMAKRHHACLAVLVLALLGPLMWFAQVIVALVTLRRGATEGGIVLLAACVPGLVLVVLGGDPWLFAETVVNFAILLAMATIIRRTESWGTMLQLFALLGLVVIALVHVINPNIAAWWRQELLAYFVVLKQQFPNLFTHLSKERISEIASFATGLLIGQVMISSFLQLLLARFIQAKMYNPGALRSEINRSTRLSLTAAVVVITCIIAAEMNFAVAQDILPVVVAPFFLVGMCLMHDFASVRKKAFILILLYILLVPLFPIIARMMVVLALVDTCFKIRERWQLQNS